MSKQGEIPYSWEEIEEQVERAIRCQARVLQAYGPSGRNASVLAEFLGVPEQEAASKDAYDIEKIDISRHVIHQLVSKAYSYAYQLDGWWDCSVDDWADIEAILLAYPQADENGDWSPLTQEHDYPLRLMIETFLARFKLFDPDVVAGPLTVRELSLLANMTVQAVRNSLSKEGYKLERVKSARPNRGEEKEYRLNEDDAIAWLSRRRGFIPQKETPEFVNGKALPELIQNTLSDKAVAFNLRIKRGFDTLDTTSDAFAEANAIDPVWVRSMIAGEPVVPDIGSLCALARGFGYSEPDLAADGVRYLLTVQERMAPSSDH